MTGTVRLIFKPLLPVFPLFGAIEISLASKPEVDFDLRVIGNDITLVPGAAPALRTFLKNILNMVMVGPPGRSPSCRRSSVFVFSHLASGRPCTATVGRFERHLPFRV